MQISNSACHMDLTSAMKDYARKKMRKRTRTFSQPQQPEILLDDVKHGCGVEIIADDRRREQFVMMCTDHESHAWLDVRLGRAAHQRPDHKSRIQKNEHQQMHGSQEHPE